MSVEENKAIARRFWEESWNTGNLASVDEIFAPDRVSRSVSNCLPKVALNSEEKPSMKPTIVKLSVTCGLFVSLMLLIPGVFPGGAWANDQQPMQIHPLLSIDPEGIGIQATATAAPTPTKSEVEPNNSPATANPVAVGDVVSGAIEPSNSDEDYFAVHGNAGDILVFETFGRRDGTSNLYPLLTFFDTNGTTVLRSASFNTIPCCDAILGIALPSTGTFFLRVTNTQPSTPPPSTYILAINHGGLIQGKIADGEGFVPPFYPNFVMGFTPGGKPVGRANVTCCSNNMMTYELVVPAGTYRVGAQGRIASTWYQNKPTFLQATDIQVNNNQQITGIDLILDAGVKIQPQLNRSDFIKNDRLILDLLVKNLAPSPATITAAVRVEIPDQPGINVNDFCCFRQLTNLIEVTRVPIAANTNIVVRDFFTYIFNGSEPKGFYQICVEVLQQGVSTFTGRCTSFRFQ